jgi:hypothetical protein
MSLVLLLEGFQRGLWLGVLYVEGFQLGLLLSLVQLQVEDCQGVVGSQPDVEGSRHGLSLSKSTF